MSAPLFKNYIGRYLEESSANFTKSPSFLPGDDFIAVPIIKLWLLLVKLLSNWGMIKIGLLKLLVIYLPLCGDPGDLPD